MSKTFIAVVGEEGKEFMLHTDVASRSSKFFAAATNRDWRESRQNRVNLVELEVKEFEQYLQWLSTHDHSFLDGIHFTQLARLYILGDFLDDSAFRVFILNIFVKQAVEDNVYPAHTTVILTCEQTPESSPLRKIIVEIWNTASIKSLANRLTSTEKDVPKEFIADCLHRIGDTQARANESILGYSRRRAIESRRDELLMEILA